jgi:hypothetical protein
MRIDQWTIFRQPTRGRYPAFGLSGGVWRIACGGENTRIVVRQREAAEQRQNPILDRFAAPADRPAERA